MTFDEFLKKIVSKEGLEVPPEIDLLKKENVQDMIRSIAQSSNERILSQVNYSLSECMSFEDFCDINTLSRKPEYIIKQLFLSAYIKSPSNREKMIKQIWKEFNDTISHYKEEIPEMIKAIRDTIDKKPSQTH